MTELQTTELDDEQASRGSPPSLPLFAHSDSELTLGNRVCCSSIPGAGAGLADTLASMGKEASARGGTDLLVLVHSRRLGVTSETRSVSRKAQASYTVLEHAQRRDVGPGHEDHQLSLRDAIVLADPLIPFAMSPWTSVT